MSTMRAHEEFAGVPRAGRPAGVRDHVLVMPSVICSALVSEAIADAVPGTIAVPHDHGCAQIGGDKDQTRRTLLNVAANPNVAGVVLVGLGCETLTSETLREDVDVPVRQLSIQGTGSTEATIEAGIASAASLVESESSDRSPADLAELTIGIAASDFAASTREQAAPVVGSAVDRLVDAGCRVLIAGLEPLRHHHDKFDTLTASTAVTDQLTACIEDRTTGSGNPRLSRQTEAVSIDEVCGLWGQRPIVDVLAYGEAAAHDRGVAILDAPTAFEEAATGLVAGGAQLIVHATAAGIPTGHPVSPVISVTGDAETAAVMGRDLDLDATAAAPADLLELVTAVAGGKQVAAERHGLAPFAISRAGPSL